MSSPSAIFDLWQSTPKFMREQIRVVCPAFNGLRRELNRLAMAFIEMGSDDASRVAMDILRVRRELECQLVPFDGIMLSWVTELGGGRAALRMRWGEGPSRLHDALVKAGCELLRSGNAIAQVLASATGQLEGETSVWCHRDAKGMFDEHIGAEIRYLHSLPGYRSSATFDNLVILGGLRRRGIGHVPESVLLAPHFRSLLQIMWSTDKDDPEFGHSTSTFGFNFNDFWCVSERAVECGHPNCNGLESSVVDEPDAAVLEEWVIRKDGERRRVSNATFLTLGGKKGLALHSGGRAMVFNVADGSVVEKEAHEVEVGDVLVTYEGEIDFGEPFEQDHELVRKWRNDLRCTHTKDPDGFLSALKKNGVALKGLSSCVDHWMNDRRPQRQVDLERVCVTLGWGKSSTQKLWKIFSEQHGKDIQAGAAGRELEREEIEKWVGNSEVKDALAELPRSSEGQRSFDIRVAGDQLFLKAYVVDHVDHAEFIDETKIGRTLNITEFPQ